MHVITFAFPVWEQSWDGEKGIRWVGIDQEQIQQNKNENALRDVFIV